MRAYEGMPAYIAGIEEGKSQVVKEFNEHWRPTVLNMLALIEDTSEEESTIELARDIYDYITAVNIDTFTCIRDAAKVLNKEEGFQAFKGL